MKHNVIRYSLLVLLSGMVAASTARAQAPTEQTRQITIIQDMAPVGLVYGQSLRISVFNPLPSPPPGADGRKYKMLVAVVLIDSDGRVLALSDEVALDPGRFHSFDFNRATLPLAGEAGAGRLQMRGEIRHRFFSIVDRTRLAPQLRSAVEIIDNSTGRTTAVWFTTGFFEVATPSQPQ